MLGHILVLCEVLKEAGGEVLCLGIVSSLVGPYIARVEYVVRYARAGGGNKKVEDLVMPELGLFEVAVEGGRDDGAGELNAHALAYAIGASGPAGVDEVDVRIVFLNPFSEHLGVYRGAKRKEGSTKAGGEGGLRFHDAALRTGKLGCIAGNKMVHSHVLIELGNGGQHAERVRGEEDDGLGVAADAGNGAVGDILHRISDAGILGEGTVVIIGGAGLFVDNNVFYDCTKFDGVPDLRLVFLGEVNRLRVAAAFDVEDTIGAPAVLVVSDEHAVRVSAQGGFTGAGEAEEQRGIAVFSDVGAAVHGEYILLWQEVVHDGEYALFDLAAVLAACDDNHALFKMHKDGRFGTDAVHRRDALEAGRCNYGEAGNEAIKLFLGRPQKELVNKQVLAGKFVDDAHRKMVFFIRTCEAVENEDLAAL